MTTLKKLTKEEKEKWISAVLTNDENSTNDELIDYFVENGLSNLEANIVVSYREDYLNGRI